MINNHRNPKDQITSIKWAFDVLQNKEKYVILDTETTGLGKNDVIVQIGIIDLDGNSLLNTLVKPTKRKKISSEATDIHGIKIEDLENSPILCDLITQITSICNNKKVLIYNSEYDERLFDQTIKQDDNCFKFLSFNSECVMLQYSKYKGSWNEHYQEYRFQKLPSGDHSAIGDCLATLKVIKKMATDFDLIESNIQTGPPEKQINKRNWWEFWKA